MAIRKLQPVGGSAGVTVPRDDLRLDSLVENDGELDGKYRFHVQRVGEGEWTYKLVEGIKKSGEF